jgi:hypothetical protein
MSLKANSILRSAALLGAAVAALAMAPVATAQAPRPDFPGAKQSSSKEPTLKQKCATYAQHNAGEAEPGARTAFYESCMHGMNTTAK